MFRSFMAAAVLAVFAMPAQAGILSSLLSYDGMEDEIQDDSVGTFTTATAGVLAVGDVISGMISLDPVDGNNVPAGTSIIGAYSFEVETIAADKKSATFKAASGASSIGSILTAAGVDANGVDYTGAGLAVLESGTADVNSDDFAGPTFGFTVASGVTGADFKTVVSLGVLEHVLARPLGDITDLTTPPSIFDPIGFFGTYNVVDHALGASTIFLPVTNSLSGTVGDAKIEDGRILVPSATDVANGWSFGDDGNYFINPVPEPGTYAAFAAIGMIGFVARRRRNKK